MTHGCSRRLRAEFLDETLSIHLWQNATIAQPSPVQLLNADTHGQPGVYKVFTEPLQDVIPLHFVFSMNCAWMSSLSAVQVSSMPCSVCSGNNFLIPLPTCFCLMMGVRLPAFSQSLVPSHGEFSVHIMHYYMLLKLILESPKHACMAGFYYTTR